MNLLSLRNIAAGIGLCLCSVISALGTTTNQWQLTTLRSFGNPERNGNQAVSGVILASDGRLYGTCTAGGYGGGTVFRVSTKGQGYQQIHNFLPPSGAFSGLMEASDGKLYGAIVGSGETFGALYAVNKDGSGFQMLHEFAGPPLDGANSSAKLIEASDGMLYGTTRRGGSNDLGTAFRINKDGGGYEIIHQFSSDEAVLPSAPLLETSDGALYGLGDIDYFGDPDPIPATVYKVNKDGSNFQVLHQFAAGTHFDAPQISSGLVEGTNGRLFGATYSFGLTNGGNLIFSIAKDGQDFQALEDLGGVVPWCQMWKAKNGRLYGATANGGQFDSGELFTLSEDGTGFAVIKSFGRNKNDTAWLMGALAHDASGAIYGIGYGNGYTGVPAAIFAVRGTRTQLLWKFDAGGGDATGRASPVVLGTNGLLYGQVSDPVGGAQRGWVFQISTNGSNFKKRWDPSSVGWNPQSIAPDAANGDLYVCGSISGRDYSQVLLNFSPDGKKKLVHQFGNTFIRGDAVDGGDGFLYGTLLDSPFGSARIAGVGWSRSGSIYRVQKDGRNFQTLHQFVGAEGGVPSILVSTDSLLYGTCIGQGTNGTTFFRLNRDGSDFTVLRTFADTFAFIQPPLPAGEGVALQIVGTNDITYPHILFESDNSLYGTDYFGRYFKIEKDGSGLAVLRSFGSAGNFILASDGKVYGNDSSWSDGALVFRMNVDASDYTQIYSGLSPGAMALGPDGALYGTTATGGPANSGFVFRLAP